MSYELNIRCSKCTRFMLIKASKSSDIEVRCNDRACKTWNTIKVVMLSDMYGQAVTVYEHERPNNKLEEYENTIKALQAKADELDGRTKEAKELKAQIEDLKKAHETDQNYIQQLEGIIDGQG